MYNKKVYQVFQSKFEFGLESSPASASTFQRFLSSSVCLNGYFS